MLAKHASLLLNWLDLVITSRPDSAVTGPLQSLNPYIFDPQSKDNLDDIRGYLLQKTELELDIRPDAARLLGQILDKNEGVFLNNKILSMP